MPTFDPNYIIICNARMGLLTQHLMAIKIHVYLYLQFKMPTWQYLLCRRMRWSRNRYMTWSSYRSCYRGLSSLFRSWGDSAYAWGDYVGCVGSCGGANDGGDVVMMLWMLWCMCVCVWGVCVCEVDEVHIHMCACCVYIGTCIYVCMCILPCECACMRVYICVARGIYMYMYVSVCTCVRMRE